MMPRVALLAMTTSTLFLLMVGCENAPPPPAAEEEIPEAYKIMMANKQAKKSAAPATTPTDDEVVADTDQSARADAALARGKLAETVALCQEASAKGSPCITSHAMAHYLLGDMEKACKLFKTARGVDALSPELGALYTVRCTRGASNAAPDQESVQPVDPEVAVKAAEYFAGMSEAEAREKARELGQEANKTVFAGDPGGAIEDCRMALTKGYMDCHRIMGVAYKMKGDIPRACTSFGKALESKPANADGIKKQMEQLECS